jgi:hypothetical protein
MFEQHFQNQFKAFGPFRVWMLDKLEFEENTKNVKH